MSEIINITLPNNEIEELELGKPIVIVGANGAGKTRFSVAVESLNDKSFSGSRYSDTYSTHIHRITAQKSLSINDTISIIDKENAEKELYIGSTHQYNTKTNSRFNNHPATFLVNDFNKALSLMFAENNSQLQKAHNEDKEAIHQGKERPEIIVTISEKIERIWNELLPHRKIDFSGNGVHVLCNENRYHGQEMSDGERVILYMICQIMVQRSNTLLIIDEPELHIHKSLMNKLWSILETERQDCVFMYITHDLDFAVSRKDAKTIWIKDYDGSNWNYEFIDVKDYSDIPSQLLYEMIGTRQKILFVEGTNDSYDVAIYREIFENNDFHVLPCNSCEEVIRNVKAKESYEQFNNISVFGIVDRDYRTQNEIEANIKNQIYSLDVAEVENLFIVPEIIDIVGESCGCSAEQIQEAKDEIVKLFSSCKESQMKDAFKTELKYQLSIIDIGKVAFDENDIFDVVSSKINIDLIKEVKQNIIDKFNCDDDIYRILEIFNKKSLSKSVGAKLGLSNTYTDKVLTMIKNNTNGRRDELLNAIKKYIPEIKENED